MKRVLLQMSLIALVGEFVLSSSAAIAKEITLDDFETRAAPAPWKFYNGAEFPGATGSLSKAAGHIGSGAHLAYDFSGGGSYVDAGLTLQTPIDAAAIGFWAKAEAIDTVLRVVDSTGQTLQFERARPLDALDGTAWFRLVVELDAPTSYWGGQNDGVVHRPIREVDILASNPFDPAKKVGALDFDDVAAIDVLGETIDLSATPTTAAPTSAADLASHLGVNIHFFKDDAGLDAAKAMGFTRARMDFGWGQVESANGVYDFTNVDSLVASLAARGMTLHLILDYANALYPPTGGPAFVSTTVPAFAAVSKATAAHLQGKGVTYEVWNEANLGSFWPPAPDSATYAALSKATIVAVHQGDASAKIATTGISGFDLQFLRGYLAAGGAVGADAVGVHPYRQNAPESVSDELVAMRAITNALPGSPPIWDTEWGYSSAWYGDGQAAAGRTKQGRLVAREMLTAWSVGFPLAVDYDLRDDGTSATNAEHNFGLLLPDYSRKPSGTGVQVLSDVAKGRRFVAFLDLVPTSMHAMRLDGDADVVVAVWSDAPNSGVPVTLVQAKSAIDWLGGPVDVSSGAITVTENQGPLYITFDKPGTTSDAGVVDARADTAARSDADIASSGDADGTASGDADGTAKDASQDVSSTTAHANASPGCGCTTARGSDASRFSFVLAIALTRAALRRRARKAG